MSIYIYHPFHKRSTRPLPPTRTTMIRYFQKCSHTQYCCRGTTNLFTSVLLSQSHSCVNTTLTLSIIIHTMLSHSTRYFVHFLTKTYPSWMKCSFILHLPWRVVRMQHITLVIRFVTNKVLFYNAVSCHFTQYVNKLWLPPSPLLPAPKQLYLGN
jgi:hypothetical protein